MPPSCCCMAIPPRRTSGATSFRTWDGPEHGEIFRGCVLCECLGEGVIVQRPLSFSCMTVPAGPPLWKSVATWYLVAEHDYMIVPATQRFMAERMKAKIKPHAVDHTPIVTAPGAVVDMIRDAMDFVTGN